jgi:hypothetical protein
LIEIRNKNPTRLRFDSAPCRWRIPLPKERPQSMLTQTKLNTLGMERATINQKENKFTGRLIERTIHFSKGTTPVRSETTEGSQTGSLHLLPVTEDNTAGTSLGWNRTISEQDQQRNRALC